MSDRKRTYHFGDETIHAKADLSPDQVRTTWAGVHPALANAETQEQEDGSIRFTVRAGTKG